MNLKKLKELKNNKKGFTLIEIIVVIVILSVLLAIAVPAVMKYINEADNAKYYSQARGAFIQAQTDVAKQYIATNDKSTVPAIIKLDPDSELTSTNPAVKSSEGIEAYQVDGQVTKAKIIFQDNTVVYVLSNDQMSIDEEPASWSTTNPTN